MAQACSKCGKTLSDRSKFCPQCGAPTSASAAVVGNSVRIIDGGEAALDLGATGVAMPRRRITRVNSATASGRSEPADFGQRLGAFLFDLLLFMIVLMAATFLLSVSSNKSIVGSQGMLLAFYGLAIVLFAVNYVLLPGRAGQTVGKRLVGIRIVKEDGTPVSLTNVLLRHCVGYTLSALGGMLGFVWVTWDRKHQGWHDKIAHTVVVLAR